MKQNNLLVRFRDHPEMVEDIRRNFDDKQVIIVDYDSPDYIHKGESIACGGYKVEFTATRDFIEEIDPHDPRPLGVVISNLLKHEFDILLLRSMTIRRFPYDHLDLCECFIVIYCALLKN